MGVEQKQHTETTRYEVEIVGHEAPFKWRLIRSCWKGTMQTDPAKTISQGDANFMDEAIELAENQARLDARHRKWEATKNKCLLFEVEEEAA